MEDYEGSLELKKQYTGAVISFDGLVLVVSILILVNSDK